MKKNQFGFLSAMLILAIGLTTFLVNSCKHEGIPAEQMPQICFTGQVLPIFQNSCATTGCHSAGGDGHGYDFSNYASIMKAITPGDASKSKAYKAITSTFQLMPPDNALPIEKRIIIRLWIEQGANETTCGTDGVVTGGTKSGTSYACYERDIQPILLSGCAISGCHDATTHKEGLDFSSYAKTLTTISKGNPAGSKLYKAITASPSSEDFMPPKPYSALSKTAIDSIYNWIKRGGLNEECASVCDTTGTIKYSSHIKSIIDLACVSCHGENSPSGGINLLTAANLQTVAKSGKLLGAIKRKTGYSAMPPAYALSTCELRQIELWMNQGYN
ncbi:MAG: hypothetical protein JZU47_20540 [Prolixibacteraceae bacterium]|nr:hypothetical protein [Prolixibacteraceae bacterium]